MNIRDKLITLKAHMLMFKHRKIIAELKNEITNSGGGGKCSVFAAKGRDGSELLFVALGEIHSAESDNILYAPYMIHPTNTLIDRVFEGLRENGISLKTWDISHLLTNKELLQKV